LLTICSALCLVRFIFKSLLNPAGVLWDSHSAWIRFRGAGHLLGALYPKDSHPTRLRFSRAGQNDRGRGIQPGKPAQVDRPLRLPSAHKHAAIARSQRVDVPWPYKVVGARRRVDDHPNAASPLGCRARWGARDDAGSGWCRPARTAWSAFKAETAYFGSRKVVREGLAVDREDGEVTWCALL